MGCREQPERLYASQIKYLGPPYTTRVFPILHATSLIFNVSLWFPAYIDMAPQKRSRREDDDIDIIAVESASSSLRQELVSEPRVIDPRNDLKSTGEAAEVY